MRMMLQPSPTDIRLLTNLVNDAAILLARYWDRTIPEIRSFLDGFSMLVKKFNSELGSLSFAFEIASEGLTDPSESSITVEEIASLLEAGKEVARIDFGFRFEVHPTLALADRTDVCNHSEARANVVFLVEGSGFIIIAKGVQKQYINVFAPGAREPRLTRYSHSCREYKMLINEHHSLELPNEMDEYWAIREKRVLVAQRRTEWVFHKSLWKWLLVNVNDGRVVGEVQRLSPERTDIEIQGLRGNGTYIIEVKWLGRNSDKPGYDYDQPRIKEGVDQVKAYLTSERTVVKAILVCYDGRSKADHEKRSQIDDADQIARADYFVLYLPSEAASNHGGN